MYTTTDNELTECGVDYLTLHTPDWPMAREMTQSGLVHYYMERIGAVAPLSPRGVLGYSGVGDEHFFLGQREDGWLRRFSSKCADWLWPVATGEGDKPSRIDIQVTIDGFIDPVETIGRYEAEALINATKIPSSRKRTISTYKDSNQGCTLYIGSRASDKFGRIYNKYAQSKESHYAGCIRFEVEYHGDEAAETQSYLFYNKDNYSKAIFHLVDRFFRERGVPLPVQAPDSSWYPIASPLAQPSEQITMQWLRKQVAPAIHRLLKYHTISDILTALRLDDNVRPID